MLARHGSFALTTIFLLLSLAVCPVVWSPTQLNAQDADVWGVVRNAATGLPLVAEISIVRPEGPEMVFLHARTDTSGWYEAGALPSGRYLLVVRAEGHGFAVRDVFLEPGQTLGPIDFELRSAATLRGKLVDEQGLPLAGATVRTVYLTGTPVFFDWL